jgi:beta-lactamase class D
MPRMPNKRGDFRYARWVPLLFLSAASGFGQLSERILDLSKHFDGLSGAFVLYHLTGDTILRHNPLQCAARFSPASTFKIPNSLIGLETGVIHDMHTVIPWDSVVRPITAWNRDHDLSSAIRYSVVPYYQELARRVGRQRMQQWVDTLAYGNCDISGPIDRFWLGSSLLISANEQIDFLVRFCEGTLPVTQRSLDIVKEILIQEATPEYTLRAKTGFTTQSDSLAVGWYVGYLETKRGRTLFALNIISHDAERDGDRIFQSRISIARAIFHDLGIL